MRALVIGATGIIGNHIVRALLEAGHSVRAGSRGLKPKKNLENLDVELITLDLADVSSLKKAVSGVDWVFQAAAYYPESAFHKSAHLQKGREGTKNLIAALQQSSVQKLIYTSSLTTIGRAKPGQLAHEGLAYDLSGHDPHPYFAIKHEAEQTLLEVFQKQGLPVVIMNPTGCFGPYELKPVELCLVPQLVKAEMPAIVNRPMNVVDTADVGRGHVQAALKGRLGERYILGGHNTTTKEMIHEICQVAGVKPPTLTVPLFLGLSLCQTSEFWGYLTGQPPRYSSLGLRFVQFGQHFSSAKAEKELGYTAGPMASCYARAIAWYKKIGYC